jgi:aspartate racemase
MTYRKVGILGGMGPAAGLYFAQLLIELNASASHDASHVPFILSSNPAVPSRVDAYLRGGANPTYPIAAALQALHEQGADFGVVICNTAHIYFNDIASQTSLPLINMVENTVAHWWEHDHDSHPIGLLATQATARSGLYAKLIEAKGGQLILPDDRDQERISAAIFDPTYGIKATRNTPSAKACQIIADVAANMRDKAGIRNLLLGCTELSLAVRSETWEGLRIVDPVRILARTCLRQAGISTAQDRTVCIAA